MLKMSEAAASAHRRPYRAVNGHTNKHEKKAMTSKSEYPFIDQQKNQPQPMKIVSWAS
jgi:hypothetical protein